ncbi:MAG TPA: peptidoglycan DD-metalloendopeptidase family protein [Solirubrobacterales bacterium]|nr:peptidoglycan DD-metalloendopeptidase family protein [Solirubrobacterales bacterium]
MSGTGFLRPGTVGKIGVMAVIAVLAFFAGRAAAATTGGAGTPGAAPSAKGSPAGAPSSAPSAGALTLVSAETSPRKSFYFGYRYPKLTFTIGSSQPENDLQIEVVNSAGEAVKTFYRENVAPEVATKVRWDGTTDEGRPARNGRYSFRISPQGAAPAPAARKATASTTLSLGFAFYGYAFPVLGPHEFEMGAGRFGAPRAGHTHQGQDVMAACGTPLVAARGGIVQYAGYQSAAGNYLVIDGRGTPDDFMYAHLAEPSPLHTGETVRTGQPIGIVGETGDAVGCHLHFEMWSPPGWYQGGSPFDPLPYLERWDAYS